MCVPINADVPRRRDFLVDSDFAACSVGALVTSAGDSFHRTVKKVDLSYGVIFGVGDEENVFVLEAESLGVVELCLFEVAVQKTGLAGSDFGDEIAFGCHEQDAVVAGVRYSKVFRGRVLVIVVGDFSGEEEGSLQVG